MDCYSAAVSRLGLLRISADGSAQFGSTTLTSYAGVAAPDMWHELHVSMDVDAKTATGYVDGQLLSTVAFTGTDFNDVRPVRLADGYEKGYYDDYSVDVVPEPATMAALGMGVAALLRRRRR